MTLAGGTVFISVPAGGLAWPSPAGSWPTARTSHRWPSPQTRDSVAALVASAIGSASLTHRTAVIDGRHRRGARICSPGLTKGVRALSDNRRSGRLASLRTQVPERHVDWYAVQFAAQGRGLQRRDVPAGCAEDVAQRRFGHRRSPVLACRIGVGETAEQQGGARPGGPVHRGHITLSALVIEGVEQAAVDHGVERVGVAVELGGVGHRERDVDSGVAGPLLGGGQGGGGDVQPGYRVTAFGQVDGVVAEPAADIEDVAVDPAASLPPDDTLAGRLVIPRWFCNRR